MARCWRAARLSMIRRAQEIMNTTWGVARLTPFRKESCHGEHSTPHASFSVFGRTWYPRTIHPYLLYHTQRCCATQTRSRHLFTRCGGCNHLAFDGTMLMRSQILPRLRVGHREIKSRAVGQWMVRGAPPHVRPAPCLLRSEGGIAHSAAAYPQPSSFSGKCAARLRCMRRPPSLPA